MVVTGGVIAVGEGVPILSNVRGAPPAPAFPIEILDVTGKQTVGKMEIDYSATIVSKTGSVLKSVIVVATPNLAQSVTADLGSGQTDRIQGVITVDSVGDYPISIAVGDLQGNPVADTKTITVSVV